MIMARDGRAPNRSSSAYKGADGYWHGRVSMGVDDSGKPDRRHVTAPSRVEVTRKIRELERLRDSGRAATAGRAPTVGWWLTHWLENIAARTVRRRTLDGYRTYVDRYAIPSLGAHRLDRLQPEHVEALYSRMERDGLAPGTVHSLHRILRAALNEAVRRDKLLRNPVTRARPPRLVEREMEPLSHRTPRVLSLSRTSNPAALDGRSRWRSGCARASRSGSPGTTSTSTPGSSPSDAPCSGTPAATLRRQLRSELRRQLPGEDPRRARTRRTQEPGRAAPHRAPGTSGRAAPEPPSRPAQGTAACRLALGGARARVHPADGTPDRPKVGLEQLEDTSRHRRRPGCTTARRPAHRRHPAARPGRERTDRHGRHGGGPRRGCSRATSTSSTSSGAMLRIAWVEPSGRAPNHTQLRP